MNFIIKSNIFVSICTASLTYLTYILYDSEVDYNLLILVFFSTLFIYSFHRLVKYFGKQEKFPSRKNGDKILWIINCIISLIMILPLLFYLDSEYQIWFFIAGMLATWYTVSLIKRDGYRLTLRRIPFLKLLLIAIVWTFMTLNFPLLNQEITPIYYLIFIERFLFVLAITIPFDIRDMQLDKLEGLKTFPIQFGMNTMKLIALMITVLFMLLAFIGYYLNMHDLNESMALILSGLITAFLISRVNENRKALFYTFGMESMSLLQFLLVLLFTQLLYQ